ncbi:hypothetical protein Plhal304r1_c040g0118511 [Plasmopara halstedii]
MGAAAPESLLTGRLARVSTAMCGLFAKLKTRRRLPSDCRPATYGFIHHVPASSMVSNMGESSTAKDPPIALAQFMSLWHS